MKKGFCFLFLLISSISFSQERFISEDAGTIDYLKELNYNISILSNKLDQINSHMIERDKLLINLIRNINEIAEEHRISFYTN